MPELPEVETVVRSIRPLIAGKTIAAVFTAANYPQVIATHSPQKFNRLVAGQSVVAVGRRGKYIVISLDTGFILIHLRMTGRLLSRLGENDKPQHVTITINFQDGSKLFFKDYRKFGRIYFTANADFLEEKLGVEPLSDKFTDKWLSTGLKQSSRKIKPLLLDQSFIAGLGNIYVDEALWTARIHPETSSKRISPSKVRQLHAAIQNILQRSIEQNGTTIINFAFGENSTGEFVNELMVFGRESQSCLRCGTTIIKIRVGQRGTHFCPKCQQKLK
ncbi:MAG: DNA-formamidopyrimidine glycosylase [Candidatus Neomarinimicrobiota bacterium]